jgi:hypothetical protein
MTFSCTSAWQKLLTLLDQGHVYHLTFPGMNYQPSSRHVAEVELNQSLLKGFKARRDKFSVVVHRCLSLARGEKGRRQTASGARSTETDGLAELERCLCWAECGWE